MMASRTDKCTLMSTVPDSRSDSWELLDSTMLGKVKLASQHQRQTSV